MCKIESLRIVLLCFFCLIHSTAATAQGINFETGLTWSQIKQKAAREGKFIFVDAYATWCGPCKLMDENVYTDSEVGEAINEKFLSIKVQMDRTQNDPEEIRGWYDDAEMIMEEYQIKAFPSYLFFSPSGNLVHRGTGYIESAQFIKLALAAINPETQSVLLLENYKKGLKNYLTLPGLITVARDSGNDSLALVIAQDYKLNYLDHLTEDELLTKRHIEFFANNSGLITSKDLIFEVAINRPERLNEMFPNLAEGIRDYVISEEEIYKHILSEFNEPKILEPNWNILNDNIKRKYGDAFSDRLILNAKIYFYRLTENWSQLINSFIAKQEAYGLDTAGFGKTMLNNFAFNIILKHSEDPKDLDKAIGWMEIILESEPSHNRLDTYANLLYKIGRINEAIKFERKALDIVEKANDKTNATLYRQVIKKMTEGEPTW